MDIEIISVKKRKIIAYSKSILETLSYIITHEDLLDFILISSDNYFEINDIILESYSIYEDNYFINIHVKIKDNEGFLLIEGNKVTYNWFGNEDTGLNIIEAIIL